MPIIAGTGFFVNKNGYFVTARHVLLKHNENEKLEDLNKIRLTKPENFPSPHVIGVELVEDRSDLDLVLLKANFSTCQRQTYFENKKCFDYLDIDFNTIPEGKEVYSFGYPLTRMEFFESNRNMSVGSFASRPRVTSAIISSHYLEIGSMFSPGPPIRYVIDKALNPGNSGGPLIDKETGKAFSVIVSFSTFSIPQPENLDIELPSTYSTAVSLKNIEDILQNLT